MSQCAEQDLPVYSDTTYALEICANEFEEHLQQGNALLDGIHELTKRQSRMNKGYR